MQKLLAHDQLVCPDCRKRGDARQVAAPRLEPGLLSLQVLCYVRYSA
jgi:hypothetical protein